MNLKLIASKAGLVLRQASPDILTGGGIILSIAALIVACSKMKKAEEVKEEFHEEVEEIKNIEEPKTKTYNKAIMKAGGKAFLKYLKVFWLPILLELCAIGAIWYSHGIMMRRNAALGSALVLSTQQLEKYRERVREKVGAEAENDLYYNLENRKVEELITDENGKEKKTKVTKKIISDGLMNPWDRIFDESNRNYSNHPGSVIAFMTSHRQQAENIMKWRATDHSNGWITLNEVYSMLGFEPTELGFQVGWVYSNFDPKYSGTQIDFGLNDFSSDIYQEFIGGLRKVIPLHFNCQPIQLSELGIQNA